jgi:phage-related protein
LASTQTATKAAIGGIGILSSAVSGIGSIFRKVFNLAKTLAVKTFTKMKDFWTEHIRPLFDPIIGVFRFIFNTVGNIYEFFINIMIDRWRAFMNIVSSLKDVIDSAFEFIRKPSFGALKDHFGVVLTFFETIWDETFGRMFTYISDIGVFDGIKSAFSRMAGVVKSVYDNTLGPVFSGMKDALGWIVDKLIDIIAKIGSIIADGAGYLWDLGGDAVGFVSDTTGNILGGGGDTTTTTRSSGGGRHGGSGTTFNMTFNVGGITDRTDKLELAREIAALIQQETARSIGSSTRTVGR